MTTTGEGKSKGRRSKAAPKSSMAGEAMKYQAVVDLRNVNNSHTQLVLATGLDKKVLEVGPAWGYMSRVLAERGCRITGVEIDPVAAKVAEQFCERVIVGDIQQLDFRSAFGRERFDVAIYGDVLEHLVHPEEVLLKTSTILKPDGYVVASIPNVAHGSIRLSLLAGDFRYTEMGLLDQTHLRFYTRDTIRNLFAEAGFVIRSWKRIILDPFATEVPIKEEDFPPRLIEEVRKEQDALTYQYVVKAARAAGPVRRRRSSSLQSSHPQVVHQLRQQISRIEAQQIEKDNQISRLDGLVASKEIELTQAQRAIAARDTMIAEKNSAITKRDSLLAEKEEQLNELMAQYERVTHTIGYRFLEKMRWWINQMAPLGTRRRSVFIVVGHAFEVLMSRGWIAFIGGMLRFWRWLPRLFTRPTMPPAELPTGPTETLSLDDQYRLWLHANELTNERRQTLAAQARELNYRPTISIIVPVFNTEPRWLEQAIESVRRQIYDKWELCLADDGSSRRDTRQVLRRYRRRGLLRRYLLRDPRVKVVFLKGNRGIAKASNEALRLATGGFVGLLDHDDELKPDALLEVVKLLNANRELDYIYTDEDKKDEDEQLVEPFFKPDWSPDLLECINYVTHFSVYRREVLDAVGAFREGYEGSQDYDLVLRVSEITDKIAHIPKPLYTWRKIPGSAAGSVEAKPFAYEAAKRALKDSLSRRGSLGRVVDGSFRGSYRVRYAIVGTPRVEIIIPTRDRVDLLQPCIESIVEHSTYGNYEISVVDNQSRDQKTLKYLDSFGGRVLRFPNEFNFSKIVNLAGMESTADFLLFLNNDTKVISPEWIEAMLEHAQRQQVAAVGAKLLFTNGRPQHEGIIVGPFRGLAINAKGIRYFGLEKCVRNCSAVTAASMMTRREVFWELGGFEERLGVAYNDVDFCLRAREKGYLIVYTPHAQLYHQESKTRGSLHPKEDEQFFRQRWDEPEQYQDPYWNPNLDPTKPSRLVLPPA
jgi:GT2 family glycosyltransferase/2-polyprenyl-3-methyl-5-hydroxy-6-metoxy-1,4-benzoquinol methylase